MNKNKRRSESKNKNKKINKNKSKNIDKIKEKNRANNDNSENYNGYEDNYDVDSENDIITLSNNASVGYKDDEFNTIGINNNNDNNNAESNLASNKRQEESKKEHEKKHEKKNKRSKKNILSGIIIIILIIALVITFLELYFTKQSNQSTEDGTSYYGQRGNISDTEKIMFLSKEDDYLIGMMGLEYSTEEVEFDNDKMTVFALYIAMERYSNILTMEQEFDGNFKYRIDTGVIDDIIEEFFGVTGIIYSVEDNEYYSQSRGYFLFNEQFEKSIWFYPINEETVEENIKYANSNATAVENEVSEEDISYNDVNEYDDNIDDNETSTNTNTSSTSEDEDGVELVESYIVITADAIYIDETLEEKDYKNAKYEGMYDEDCVEYTIKLKFDEDGYLVSYQYVD